MIELKGTYTDAKIFIDEVEDGVFSQIHDIINSSASEGLKVRIMPDTHVGAKICIGFTMELGKYIKPSTIGCDIGCGVLSASFSNRYSMDLEKIDENIREKIPMGGEIHEEEKFRLVPFEYIQEIANTFIKEYNEKFKTSYTAPTYNEEWLNNLLKKIEMNEKTFYSSIGTLGGGNHFIEIGRSDTTNNYWVTIHTGSRNFGLKIENYWTKIAQEKLLLKEHIDGYLYGKRLVDYLFDMIFAQQYAIWNRNTILSIIKKVLKIKKFEEEIQSVHNYIDFKDFIIRKGAISSYENEKMIIPLNMKDGILICEGKSNSDWNNSAPHGAGRVMSRGKAKESVDLKDFKKVMKNVYSTSICKSTLDESPFAYKNSKIIENSIEPTVNIIDKIKPVLNIKDKSEGESWKDRKELKERKERIRKERDDISYRKMKRMY